MHKTTNSADTCCFLIPRSCACLHNGAGDVSVLLLGIFWCQSFSLTCCPVITEYILNDSMMLLDDGIVMRLIDVAMAGVVCKSGQRQSQDVSKLHYNQSIGDRCTDRCTLRLFFRLELPSDCQDASLHSYFGTRVTTQTYIRMQNKEKERIQSYHTGSIKE